MFGAFKMYANVTVYKCFNITLFVSINFLDMK